MDSRLNNFVKAILDLCFYFGLVVIVTIPFFLKQAVNLAVYALGESTEYSANTIAAKTSTKRSSLPRQELLRRRDLCAGRERFGVSEM